MTKTKQPKPAVELKESTLDNVQGGHLTKNESFKEIVSPRDPASGAVTSKRP